MSFATHAACAPEVLKLASVALFVPDEICFVTNTVALCVVTSVAVQVHPNAAIGKPMTPLVAVPPEPIAILKVAVPFPGPIDGEVPKPEVIVGVVGE